MLVYFYFPLASFLTMVGFQVHGIFENEPGEINIQIPPLFSYVGYLRVSTVLRAFALFNLKDQFAALNTSWKSELTLISENNLSFPLYS